MKRTRPTNYNYFLENLAARAGVPHDDSIEKILKAGYDTLQMPLGSEAAMPSRHMMPFDLTASKLDGPLPLVLPTIEDTRGDKKGQFSLLPLREAVRLSHPCFKFDRLLTEPISTHPDAWRHRWSLHPYPPIFPDYPFWKDLRETWYALLELPNLTGGIYSIEETLKRLQKARLRVLDPLTAVGFLAALKTFSIYALQAGTPLVEVPTMRQRGMNPILRLGHPSAAYFTPDEFAECHKHHLGKKHKPEVVELPYAFIRNYEADPWAPRPNTEVNVFTEAVKMISVYFPATKQSRTISVEEYRILLQAHQSAIHEQPDLYKPTASGFSGSSGLVESLDSVPESVAAVVNRAASAAAVALAAEDYISKHRVRQLTRKDARAIRRDNADAEYAAIMARSERLELEEQEALAARNTPETLQELIDNCKI